MIILLRSEQGGLYWSRKRNNTKRVAASDLAALLCMHSWKSRQKLFQEKKFPHTKRDSPETPATLHGRFWEQYALGKVASYLDDFWELLKPGSFLDWETPFSCSPDMMISKEDKENGIDILIGIETKCPYSKPIPKKKEDISDEYLLQCFSCLMTTCSDKWILVFYDTPTDSAVAYEIYPDSDLWSREILPRVKQFLEQVQDNADSTWIDPYPKKKGGKKGGVSRHPLRKGNKEKEEGKKLRERLLKLTFPLELSSLGSGPKDNSYQ